MAKTRIFEFTCQKSSQRADVHPAIPPALWHARNRRRPRRRTSCHGRASPELSSGEMTLVRVVGPLPRHKHTRPRPARPTWSAARLPHPPGWKFHTRERPPHLVVCQRDRLRVEGVVSMGCPPRHPDTSVGNLLKTCGRVMFRTFMFFFFGFYCPSGLGRSLEPSPRNGRSPACNSLESSLPIAPSIMRTSRSRTLKLAIDCWLAGFLIHSIMKLILKSELKA